MIVYSTGCPKCEVLLTKLNEKNIDYELCTDIEKMKEKKIETVPALEIKKENGNIILHSFSEIIKYINNF